MILSQSYLHKWSQLLNVLRDSQLSLRRRYLVARSYRFRRLFLATFSHWVLEWDEREWRVAYVRYPSQIMVPSSYADNTVTTRAAWDENARKVASQNWPILHKNKLTLRDYFGNKGFMYIDPFLTESIKILSIEELFRSRDRYNVGLFFKGVLYFFFIVHEEGWFGQQNMIGLCFKSFFISTISWLDHYWSKVYQRDHRTSGIIVHGCLLFLLQ